MGSTGREMLNYAPKIRMSSSDSFVCGDMVTMVDSYHGDSNSYTMVILTVASTLVILIAHSCTHLLQTLLQTKRRSDLPSP